MRKIKSVVAVVLVVSTIMLMFSGCNIFKKSITPEELKNSVIKEATEYLKENYPDDEFTYVSGRSPNWAYNYYELAFTSKKYDNQQLTVFGEPDNETNKNKTVYNYYDNYFQYTMKEDAEKYFYNLAEKSLGENIVVKIKFEDGIGFAKKITNSNFYENFKKDNLTVLVFIFSLNSYEKEKENVYKMLNEFSQSKQSIDISYFYVKNFDNVNKYDIATICDKDYFIDRKSFLVYKDGEITSFN